MAVWLQDVAQEGYTLRLNADELFPSSPVVHYASLASNYLGYFGIKYKARTVDVFIEARETSITCDVTQMGIALCRSKGERRLF